LWVNSANGFVWSINCESWFVPKKVLITEDNVLALIRSIGVNTSLSLTFILSLIVRAILESPTPNCDDNCSPTVLTLLFERWSISSISAFELINSIKNLIMVMISSLVKTRFSMSTSRPSFLFILYLPTSPRLYLWSEKNNLSIIPLAVSSSGGSAFLSCLYICSTASFSEFVGSFCKVFKITEYSLPSPSSLLRRIVFALVSIITSIFSLSITVSLSNTTSFLSIEITSPVSSSTKSSNQVLRTLAANFLPITFFKFAFVALISSARPKISRMSLSLS